MEEIFKDVVGYEGLYQVSNIGNVKSLIFNKNTILKPMPNGRGYYQVSLYKKFKQKSFKIHRLVALAFIENKENKKTINHINGIKTDNRVDNLEWCTQSENVKHAYNIGISNKGENHYNAKLTNEQVLSIIKDNRFQKDIAKDYNVNQSVISRIKRGQTWANI